MMGLTILGTQGPRQSRIQGNARPSPAYSLPSTRLSTPEPEREPWLKQQEYGFGANR